MLPSREEVEELLTEPSEVTRVGVALASIAVALIAALLARAAG